MRRPPDGRPNQVARPLLNAAAWGDATRKLPRWVHNRACYSFCTMNKAAAVLVVLATFGANANAAPSSQTTTPAPEWQEPQTSTTWTPPSAPYQWQFDKQERTLTSFSKHALLNNKKIAIGTKLPVLAMTCSSDATRVPERKSCTAKADPEFVLARLLTTMRVAQSCFDYDFIAPTAADLRMAEADSLNYTRISAKGTRGFAIQNYVKVPADKDASARVVESFQGIGPDQDFSVANATARARFLVPVVNGTPDPAFAALHAGDAFAHWGRQAFSARAFAHVSLDALSKSDQAALLYNQAIAWHQVGNIEKSAAAVAALRKLNFTFPPGVADEVSQVLAFFKAIDSGKQLATSPCNFVRPIRSEVTGVDPLRSANERFAAASAAKVHLRTPDWPADVVTIRCTANEKSAACKFPKPTPSSITDQLLRDVEASLKAKHSVVVSVPPSVLLVVSTERNVQYRVYETGCEAAWKAHHPCDPKGSTATSKFETKVETVQEVISAARLMPWQADVFLSYALIGHREKGLWVPDAKYLAIKTGDTADTARVALEKLRVVDTTKIDADERLALSLWTAVVALRCNAPDAKTLVAHFVAEAKRRPLPSIHFELRPIVVQSLWTMDKIDRSELVVAP